MKFLLDTNVVSEQFKPKLNKKVNDWLNSINPLNAYLSIISVGEIQSGIMRLSGKRKLNFEASFENILEIFDGRILNIDMEVIKRWGNLTAERNKIGRPLPIIDSLIAATALVYDLKVVTGNIKDFKGVVDCIDPFQ